MCEQCSAATVNYVGKDGNQVLPGYFLVRATKDGREMKNGDWGLVVCNDPDFIWSITPVCDPDDGLTDEQIDALPDDKMRYRAWEKANRKLKKSLDSASFDSSIRLGNAMRDVGYVPDNDGIASWWLCNYIAKFLKTATVVKELKEESTNG